MLANELCKSGNVDTSVGPNTRNDDVDINHLPAIFDDTLSELLMLQAQTTYLLYSDA